MPRCFTEDFLSIFAIIFPNEIINNAVLKFNIYILFLWNSSSGRRCCLNTHKILSDFDFSERNEVNL